VNFVAVNVQHNVAIAATHVSEEDDYYPIQYKVGKHVFESKDSADAVYFLHDYYCTTKVDEEKKGPTRFMIHDYKTNDIIKTIDTDCRIHHPIESFGNYVTASNIPGFKREALVSVKKLASGSTLKDSVLIEAPDAGINFDVLHETDTHLYFRFHFEDNGNIHCIDKQNDTCHVQCNLQHYDGLKEIEGLVFM
jgi:hypothetical protein